MVWPLPTYHHSIHAHPIFNGVRMTSIVIDISNDRTEQLDFSWSSTLIYVISNLQHLPWSFMFHVQVHVGTGGGGGGGFKNVKFSTVNKIYIFQCMVWFLYNIEILKALRFKGSYAFWNVPWTHLGAVAIRNIRPKRILIPNLAQFLRFPMTLLLILKSLYKICTEYGRITAAFCVNFQNNLPFEMDNMDEPHCAIIHFRVFRMDIFIATNPCLRVLSITNKADRSIHCITWADTIYFPHSRIAKRSLSKTWSDLW